MWNWYKQKKKFISSFTKNGTKTMKSTISKLKEFTCHSEWSMLCYAMHLRHLKQIIIMAFNDALHLQNVILVFCATSRHVMNVVLYNHFKYNPLHPHNIHTHSNYAIFFFMFVFVCFSIQLILYYVYLLLSFSLSNLISIQFFPFLILCWNLFQFISEYSFAIWSSIKCGYPLQFRTLIDIVSQVIS